MADVERAFASYLDAERELGRVAASTDTEAAAMTLLSAVHHLATSGSVEAVQLPHMVRQVVTVLSTGMGGTSSKSPANR
jgi:hypothetical protein